MFKRCQPFFVVAPADAFDSLARRFLGEHQVPDFSIRKCGSRQLFKCPIFWTHSGDRCGILVSSRGEQRKE